MLRSLVGSEMCIRDRDGSCPPDELILKFLELTEKEKGAVAVHCKAGLGRTGTMICAYAMKHYHFPAAAWVGWNRIARPGSILGPQQQFINEKQNWLFKLGESSPIWQSIQPFVEDLTKDFNDMNLNDRMDYSPEDRRKAKLGDEGQGERLTKAKQSSHGKV
eukprot:TRINITY_DN2971_c0_g2_i3.p1 TRINITY_DN2971_c0_g2~~TRINITY_DN2971_c0_g2_i3.p1  ORF type:complete len:162 (+),score=53.92 TRINITY_DN2971_c0_g2_i3:62-547(+)